MAEYQSIKATALFKLPRNVSYDVGSVVEPFGVSYHGVLETSSLKEDQTILILGPGAIGLAAVIAAKLVSPKQIIVTGTTADEAVRFKLAKKLGANVLINVQKEDSVKRVLEVTDGLGAEVVVEAVGGHHPQLQQGLNMLRYEGECVVIGHPERGGQAVASLDGDTYNGVILKRQKILGSWVFDTVTYVKILDLLEKKMVDLETLITHRLPLTDAEKGFELGFKQECVKAILIP